MALPIPKKDLSVMAIVAAVTAALCIYLASSDSSETTSAVESAPVTTSEAAPLELPSVRSESVLGYESKMGDLPGTMSETKLDIRLAVDESGNLRISSEIQDIFDFFLSNIEQEDLEIILSRIEEYLGHQLQEPALSQALAVLNQYVEYKTALLELEEALAEQYGEQAYEKDMYLGRLETQLRERNRYREEYLDPEVYAAFYAEEHVYDEYTLGKLKIAMNEGMSDAQKAQELEALEALLPEHQRQLRQENLKLHDLRTKTTELVSAGASSDDIQQLREDYYGAEAAQRFAALDQERAEWQGRIDTYLALRKQITENQGLDEATKQSQINALREEHFDSKEQIRVSYLEQRAG